MKKGIGREEKEEKRDIMEKGTERGKWDRKGKHERKRKRKK